MWIDPAWVFPARDSGQLEGLLHEEPLHPIRPQRITKERVWGRPPLWSLQRGLPQRENVRPRCGLSNAVFPVGAPPAWFSPQETLKRFLCSPGVSDKLGASRTLSPLLEPCSRPKNKRGVALVKTPPNNLGAFHQTHLECLKVRSRHKPLIPPCRRRSVIAKEGSSQHPFAK